MCARVRACVKVFHLTLSTRRDNCCVFFFAFVGRTRVDRCKIKMAATMLFPAVVVTHSFIRFIILLFVIVNLSWCPHFRVCLFFVCVWFFLLLCFFPPPPPVPVLLLSRRLHLCCETTVFRGFNSPVLFGRILFRVTLRAFVPSDLSSQWSILSE